MHKYNKNLKNVFQLDLCLKRLLMLKQFIQDEIAF
jgi:hypothetical protein